MVGNKTFGYRTSHNTTYNSSCYIKIKENIKTSAKESLGLHEIKQHKPWFDEECLGILDQRK
jgi:hypothetical protein